MTHAFKKHPGHVGEGKTSPTSSTYLNKKNMKLHAITAPDKVMLSDHENYSTILINCLFDGEKPVLSFDNKWVILSKIPNKIERVISGSRYIKEHTLKGGFPVSDRTPKSLPGDYFEYDDSIDDYKNAEIKGLYEAIYAQNTDTYEPLDFEIEVIATISNFDQLKPIEFGEYQNWGNEKPVIISSTNAQVSLIDKILYPKILHNLRPQALSSAQFYAIIRNHVKNNIDPKYAEITSDFDFCLTVKKKIELCEVDVFAVDINNSLFSSRKRKPKIEKRYRNHRYVEIFKTAPRRERDGVHEGYPMTPDIVAENAEALKEKIDSFLEDLMASINEPVIDCKHCKGRGVTYRTELDIEKMIK